MCQILPRRRGLGSPHQLAVEALHSCPTHCVLTTHGAGRWTAGDAPDRSLKFRGPDTCPLEVVCLAGDLFPRSGLGGGLGALKAGRADRYSVNPDGTAAHRELVSMLGNSTHDKRPTASPPSTTKVMARRRQLGRRFQAKPSRSRSASGCNDLKVCLFGAFQRYFGSLPLTVEEWLRLGNTNERWSISWPIVSKIVL